MAESDLVKVLVTCVPQAGHLNPMLPLITALVRSGSDVVVATGEVMRAEVEKTGARLEPAGGGLDAWFGQLAARTRGAPGDGLAPERIPYYFLPRLFCEVGAADAVDDVLAAGERLRPDLVMFDTQAFVGPLVAHLLGARQANHLFGPLLTPDVTQLCADAISPLWRSFGLDAPPDAGLYEGATVTICPPSLDSALPPRGVQRLLRPAPAPLDALQPQSTPVIYFSLGTLWANPDVVRTVLTGLADLPVRVVATLGALDPVDMPAAPANVELHRYIPQQEVLPKASLVIHHAGAGTMFGALSHGLPSVALPQAADNFINADLLARSGAAVTIGPAELTSDAIAAAVGQVLDDESFAITAQAIADEIAQMPTADEVAAALINTTT